MSATVPLRAVIVGETVGRAALCARRAWHLADRAAAALIALRTGSAESHGTVAPGDLAEQLEDARRVIAALDEERIQLRAELVGKDRWARDHILAEKARADALMDRVTAAEEAAADARAYVDGDSNTPRLKTNDGAAAPTVADPLELVASRSPDTAGTPSPSLPDACPTCDHPWSRHYYSMRRNGCDGFAGGFCRCTEPLDIGGRPVTK